jgi:hypothetical protein
MVSHPIKNNNNKLVSSTDEKLKAWHSHYKIPRVGFFRSMSFLMISWKILMHLGILEIQNNKNEKLTSILVISTLNLKKKKKLINIKYQLILNIHTMLINI